MEGDTPENNGGLASLVTQELQDSSGGTGSPTLAMSDPAAESDSIGAAIAAAAERVSVLGGPDTEESTHGGPDMPAAPTKPPDISWQEALAELPPVVLVKVFNKYLKGKCAAKAFRKAVSVPEQDRALMESGLKEVERQIGLLDNEIQELMSTVRNSPANPRCIALKLYQSLHAYFPNPLQLDGLRVFLVIQNEGGKRLREYLENTCGVCGIRLKSGVRSDQDYTEYFTWDPIKPGSCLATAHAQYKQNVEALKKARLRQQEMLNRKDVFEKMQRACDALQRGEMPVRIVL